MNKGGILLIVAFVLITGGTLENAALAADQSASASQKNGDVSAEEVEVAMQLANPVARLISVPFQLNYDTNIGPKDDGDRWTLNIQPVIPISISEDWSIISRTILPVISQNDIFPGAGSQNGIGDIIQSLFLSPRVTTSGWVWGAGPVFLLPTGSNDLLTTDKWAAGPTGVALRQQGPWTYGILANHLWSFAGDDDRDDVNASFMQPFLTYTTPTAVTYGVQTESTYNWDTEQWSVPINCFVSKVTRIGNQMVSFTGGVRYWADSPDNGPEGWGGRLVMTLIFPR